MAYSGRADAFDPWRSEALALRVALGPLRWSSPFRGWSYQPRMIRSWYPPARGPHVMVSFFRIGEWETPKIPLCFFLSQKHFVGRRANEGQVFLLVMPQWWRFFLAKACLMGSWNQDPGFFEKYWNTSQSNADWNHRLRQEYLRWFHLMD